MRIFKKALCVSAALAMGALANADLKVATVDTQKLFTDFYKTHEAQAEVDKAAKALEEENQVRVETIKKMDVEFQDMVKKLQDPMLNEADKKTQEQKARIKQQELIALEQERRNYLERNLKSIQEQMRVRTARILEEINQTAGNIATQNNYDLVLDKSARSQGATQVFVYTKPSLDITATVMKELNKTAPEGFDPSKKAPATTIQLPSPTSPAPAAAPAAPAAAPAPQAAEIK